MATFVATLFVFAAVVVAMSLGAMIQGRRLKGSCGGSGEDCTCSPLAARNCRLRQERDAASAR
jgi:hypothetical protein